MQGTIAMLMVLSGLGCHHKGCTDCYATPYAGGCYTACYDVGYMPYAPACYAGTYAGGCYGTSCYSSCYSSSCYGSSCYGSATTPATAVATALATPVRSTVMACSAASDGAAVHAILVPRCTPVAIALLGGCYGSMAYMGDCTGPLFGSYTPVYGPSATPASGRRASRRRWCRARRAASIWSIRRRRWRPRTRRVGV